MCDRNEQLGRPFTRREFLKVSAVAGIGLASAPKLFSADSTPGEIPVRELGKTGVKVSAVGLGGYHIGIPDEQESIRMIRSAIDRGITFMDNCWDYHNGKSEIYMGKALRDGYRDKVFLMSKIDGHTKEAAAKQIEESLKRLQTDRIDLMQFHEVIRDTDPDKIFGEGGSAEAMLEAKKAGKIRFFGFTGHKDPAIHLKCLRVAAEKQFPFDAVQMPLNVMDAHFRSFEKQVLPELVKNRIGVLGMKPLGSGAIVRNGGVTAIECLHYAMSLPTSTVITGCDTMKILDQAVEAGRTFKPMTREQITALLGRTREPAQEGQLERFKTSTQFDGTTHNPHWLG
ncbi:MAG TPA: aldo/keto reductase [Verrucomicrobiae bacterium]|nr:aldo/keto reductase [Verrucomicrobiae bacterium]